MTKHYYLVDNAGVLRFTQEGLLEFAPYFAKAGIDIRDIKTESAYREARIAASPYFAERLAERASAWPETAEFDLLRTATFGTAEELEKAILKIDRRKSLTVV